MNGAYGVDRRADIGSRPIAASPFSSTLMSASAFSSQCLSTLHLISSMWRDEGSRRNRHIFDWAKPVHAGSLYEHYLQPACKALGIVSNSGNIPRAFTIYATR